LIPAAAFAFLRGLAANNDKAWFEANRASYDSAVREPVAALVADVTTELTRRGVPLEGDPKRSVFRIHRDVRFSKDKLPYKTHAGVVWYRQGSGKNGAGILYFHLDPGGCFAAAAFYRPEPDVLDSLRERIRVHPRRFLEVLAALREAKLQLGTEEMLTRMPKGFEDLKGSEVETALRLKSFVVRRLLTDQQVQARALPSRIADLAEDAMPLLRFGWDAVDEVAAATS
jgi:uncharacterized protein (TIGR02453 family)